MRTICKCGAEWTGLRIEHCDACHQTFSGTTAGDRHRVGDHAVSIGPGRRRCLTADEIRGKGMEQNDRGVWTNGGISPFAAARVEQESPNSDEVGTGAIESPEGRQIADIEESA